MIQENVRGAQKYVGRAQWHYVSYYLWGDVPALMPVPMTRRMKSAISCAPMRFADRVANTPEEAHALHYRLPDGSKTSGLVQKRNGHGHTRHLTNQAEHDAVKGVGIGSSSWQKKEDRHPNDPRNFYSKSNARKAASARIAKIPFALAQYIAATYKPERVAA
jgi:hypothetical protein